MHSENRYAFKEWAVVCAALCEGRQSLILRKGGIHEGREGFRVERREFWLFPTGFHQALDEIVEEAHPLLQTALANQPPPGTISLSEYVVVEEVMQIENERLLPALMGLHIWSAQTIEERFRYRTPGLFALLVRVYRLQEPIHLPDSPHFAGCRSWVDLPMELPTVGLQPVLSDDESLKHLRAIRRALTPSGFA